MTRGLNQISYPSHPNLYHGIFKIPLRLCHDIETMIKKFWQGQQGDKRKIYWIKWYELTKLKMVAGMGFRDLALFNDSLLAKQARWLLQNKNSLFHRVFKAWFFSHCSIMEAKSSRSSSYAWTSILHGREVLKRGCRWRVGDDKSVSLWRDFWLPRQSNPNVLSPVLGSLTDAKDEILIDESQRQCNHSLIDGIFTRDEAVLIKSIPLLRVEKANSLFWPYTSNGGYTSKSGYQFLKKEASTKHFVFNPQPKTELWRGICSLNIPNKVKSLLWGAVPFFSLKNDIKTLISRATIFYILSIGFIMGYKNGPKIFSRAVAPRPLRRLVHERYLGLHSMDQASEKLSLKTLTTLFRVGS